MNEQGAWPTEEIIERGFSHPPKKRREAAGADTLVDLSLMRGKAMNIVPFLEGKVFGPRDIQAMSTALEDVCKTLNLADEAKSERERLAKKIIAFAPQGECNAALLRDRTLRELVYC